MEAVKKAKRVFSPEQKVAILQKIESDIGNGLTKMAAIEKQGVGYSVYNKWKKQLEVGVKSSLRNGKAPADKEKKRLERENEKLKAIILSQSQTIADLKKRRTGISRRRAPTHGKSKIRDSVFRGKRKTGRQIFVNRQSTPH